MTLLEAMEPYLDKYGLYHSRPVGPDKEPSCANGLLVTSQVMIVNRLLCDDWRGEFGGGIFNALALCQLQPGLYVRSPVQTDQEGHDDYVGVAALSCILGVGSKAKEIVDYGQNNSVRFYMIPLKYVYNNELPGTNLHRDGRINWSAWLGRDPSDIAHFMYAAGQNPNILYRLTWAISTILGAHSDPTNETSYLLQWLKIQTFYKRNQPCWMGRLAIKYWWYRFHKQGLTMKQLYSDYVNDGGIHPLSHFWEDFEQS